jgi:hypothetical protein
VKVPVPAAKIDLRPAGSSVRTKRSKTGLVVAAPLDETGQGSGRRRTGDSAKSSSPDSATPSWEDRLKARREKEVPMGVWLAIAGGAVVVLILLVLLLILGGGSL